MVQCLLTLVAVLVVSGCAGSRVVRLSEVRPHVATEVEDALREATMRFEGNESPQSRTSTPTPRRNEPKPATPKEVAQTTLAFVPQAQTARETATTSGGRFRLQLRDSSVPVEVRSPAVDFDWIPAAKSP